MTSGAVGFFVLAGVSLQGKILARGHFKLPSNLLKLAISAATLAVLDMLYVIAKGAEIGPFRAHFYRALYDTNLWFFVAYCFAGPMLLSLDRRGVFWTGITCLLLIMFLAHLPLISPYILQTIGLAFVCMAIGMELHGRQANAGLAAAVAAMVYLARVWLDDFGRPIYPAIDIVLRIVYGTACFLLLKVFALTLSRRVRPPRWANHLFVPYVIQVPLVTVVTVIATALFTVSWSVNMPPIFFSFVESMSFFLTIFVLSMLASIAVAYFFRRYDIRV